MWVVHRIFMVIIVITVACSSWDIYQIYPEICLNPYFDFTRGHCKLTGLV